MSYSSPSPKHFTLRPSLSHVTAASGPGRVLIPIWVKPGSKRAGVLGRSLTSAVVVATHARAQEGAANADLLAQIAEWLGLAKSRITITRGSKSRQKVVSVELSPGDSSQWIAELIAALPMVESSGGSATL